MWWKYLAPPASSPPLGATENIQTVLYGCGTDGMCMCRCVNLHTCELQKLQTLQQYSQWFSLFNKVSSFAVCSPSASCTLTCTDSFTIWSGQRQPAALNNLISALQSTFLNSQSLLNIHSSLALAEHDGSTSRQEGNGLTSCDFRGVTSSGESPQNRTVTGHTPDEAAVWWHVQTINGS